MVALIVMDLRLNISEAKKAILVDITITKVVDMENKVAKLRAKAKPKQPKAKASKNVQKAGNKEEFNYCE